VDEGFLSVEQIFAVNERNSEKIRDVFVSLVAEHATQLLSVLVLIEPTTYAPQVVEVLRDGGLTDGHALLSESGVAEQHSGQSLCTFDIALPIAKQFIIGSSQRALHQTHPVCVFAHGALT
jgi:hypothetical protein